VEYRKNRYATQDLTHLAKAYIKPEMSASKIIGVLEDIGYEIVDGERKGFRLQNYNVDQITVASKTFWPNWQSRLFLFRAKIRIVIFSTEDQIVNVEGKVFYKSL